MHVIPAFGRLGQKDCEFEDSETVLQKKQTNSKETKNPYLNGV
jgi:hypothetical protein